MPDFVYCPLCKSTDFDMFLTLGEMPLVNSLGDTLNKYPLNLYLCSACGLVFANTPKTPSDIFSNYSYFSSWSKTWLHHCKSLFWDLAEGNYINKDSRIVEIASNDGYMLRNFTQNGYNSVLGIEPARNVAKEAILNGIPTVNEFFTADLAFEISKSHKADCIIALNVLAHVPDVMNFLTGINVLIENDGFAVLEFHHLLSLIEKRQFDTIYHEHFSYLSLKTVEYALDKIDMRIFCAEQIPTQGGSLRIYISQKRDSAIKKFPVDVSVGRVRKAEKNFGINDFRIFNDFANAVNENIKTAREFLDRIIDSGKTIAGYGAAAKAVVFINAVGLDIDRLQCVADINPVKQGLKIPGTEIPIVSPSELAASNPDYVIIFPWNLKDEISFDLRRNMTGSTGFIVFTPGPEINE